MFKIYSDVVEFCRNRYGRELGYGRHRMTFKDGDHVIKVPICDLGQAANIYELENQGENFAKTSKDSLSDRFDILIIRAEYVEPLRDVWFSSLPTWVNFIDCMQVGHTKDGRLVAYDWENY